MSKNLKIITSGVLLSLIALLLFFRFNNKKTLPLIDEKINIKLDEGDEKINWDHYPTYEKELKESVILKDAGIYHLTGNIDEGSITVDTEDYIKLILDNVSITNPKGPAIYIENAKTIVLSLVEGTTNVLSDGSRYDKTPEEVNACLYSKDDLVLEGTGVLEVQGNYKDGIRVQDDFKMNEGTLKITALDNGIRGKDSVYIVDGNITIEAKGDAIKTASKEKEGKGFIYIKNGEFNLTSEKDGIEAIQSLIIENGDFKIKAGGGSKEETSTNKDLFWNQGMLENGEDTVSAKGVKAQENLVIANGKFVIDTLDDAIHSNKNIQIKNGEFLLSSSDVGLHADEEITIEGGSFNIMKSYEGIEAANIIILDGTISVTSSDDGINVAGGKDESSLHRPGANSFKETNNHLLTINGGTVLVNASGDGLDANGSIVLNGGKVTVFGPIDNGNGALDYDGEFKVTGGELVVLGSSGMAQNVSTSSKQNSVQIFLSSIYNGGNLVIEEENGKQILEVKATKRFSNIVLSSEKLTKNKNYVLKINNEVVESFILKDTVTTVGNQNGMPGGMGRPKR